MCVSFQLKERGTYRCVSIGMCGRKRGACACSRNATSHVITIVYVWINKPSFDAVYRISDFHTQWRVESICAAHWYRVTSRSTLCRARYIIWQNARAVVVEVCSTVWSNFTTLYDLSVGVMTRNLMVSFSTQIYDWVEHTKIMNIVIMLFLCSKAMKWVIKT